MKKLVDYEKVWWTRVKEKAVHPSSVYESCMAKSMAANQNADHITAYVCMQVVSLDSSNQESWG